MTNLTTARPAPFGAITTLHVVNKLEGWKEEIRVWWIARQTYAALNRLPDHLLTDKGLDRSGIQRFAVQKSQTTY